MKRFQQYTICKTYIEFQFGFDIEKIVKENPHYPYNIHTKYPANSNGELWSQFAFIDIGYFLRITKIAKDDFQRLKPLIISKYNKQS